MLTEKEKSEIAYEWLKYELLGHYGKELVDISPDNVKTSVGRLSKKLDIPKDKLLEFHKIVVRDIFGKIITTFEGVSFQKPKHS